MKTDHEDSERTKITAFGFTLCLAFVAGAACLFIPDATGQAKQGTVERIKVHGKSLEGNLDGDSPDRDVSIYLPLNRIAERLQTKTLPFFSEHLSFEKAGR